MELLYKYLPLNRLGIEGSGFLPNFKLSFSNVSTFNDPSECNIKYELNEDNPNDLSLFSNDFSQCPKRSKSVSMHDVFKAERDAYFKNYGILSLSRNPISSLMWSHYASGHTGFVIGFDSTYFKSKYKSFRSDGKYDVIYSDREPIIPFLNYKLPVGVLYWKDKIWSYEEEVRFIKKKSSIEKIPARFVTQIIFGYNMPIHSCIAVMLNLKNYTHIRFRKSYYVNLGSGTVELCETFIVHDGKQLKLGLADK